VPQPLTFNVISWLTAPDATPTPAQTSTPTATATLTPRPNSSGFVGAVAASAAQVAAANRAQSTTPVTAPATTAAILAPNTGDGAWCARDPDASSDSSRR